LAMQFHNDAERFTRFGNMRKFEKKAMNTKETNKDTFTQKVEMIKDSAVHAEQEAANIIKDV